LQKIIEMAVLHKKEEKIQAVLGRLPKKYTNEQFVEMFIKLYSKDWGKIKSAYIKQSQDKEPGTVINMPKPEIYLKQVLAIYLQQADSVKVEEIKEVVVSAPVEEIKKPKAAPKKKVEVTDEIAEVKKAKAPAKKKAVAEDEVTEVKKTKAPAKKSVDNEEDKPAVEKKAKAAVKKPAAKK